MHLSFSLRRRTTQGPCLQGFVSAVEQRYRGHRHANRSIASAAFALPSAGNGKMPDLQKARRSAVFGQFQSSSKRVKQGGFPMLCAPDCSVAHSNGDPNSRDTSTDANTHLNPCSAHGYNNASFAPQRRWASFSWGRSSVGRALEWHSRGQEFDPPRLHQFYLLPPQRLRLGHPLRILLHWHYVQWLIIPKNCAQKGDLGDACVNEARGHLVVSAAAFRRIGYPQE